MTYNLYQQVRNDLYGGEKFCFLRFELLKNFFCDFSIFSFSFCSKCSIYMKLCMHFWFNIEKSPLVDLCDHKGSSTHRTILSFASTDRYDPKQSPKYPQCVSQIFFTKFFRDSKSERPFTKTLFLKVIHAFLHQNRKIMTSGPLWA